VVKRRHHGAARRVSLLHGRSAHPIGRTADWVEKTTFSLDSNFPAARPASPNFGLPGAARASFEHRPPL
jgi:hypothetical protein